MMHLSRGKTALIVAVTVLGILFALPNVLSQRVLNHSPEWLHLRRGDAASIVIGVPDDVLDDALERAIDVGADVAKRQVSG